MAGALGETAKKSDRQSLVLLTVSPPPLPFSYDSYGERYTEKVQIARKKYFLCLRLLPIPLIESCSKEQRLVWLMVEWPRVAFRRGVDEARATEHLLLSSRAESSSPVCHGGANGASTTKGNTRLFRLTKFIRFETNPFAEKGKSR